MWIVTWLASSAHGDATVPSRDFGGHLRTIALALLASAVLGATLRGGENAASHAEPADMEGTGDLAAAPDTAMPATLRVGGNGYTKPGGIESWIWFIQSPAPARLSAALYWDNLSFPAGPALITSVSNSTLDEAVGGMFKVTIDLKRADTYYDFTLGVDAHIGDVHEAEQWKRAASPVVVPRRDGTTMLAGSGGEAALPTNGDYLPLWWADEMRNEEITRQFVFVVRVVPGGTDFPTPVAAKEGPYTHAAEQALVVRPWGEYMGIVRFLYDGGSREEAAARFRQLAANAPSAPKRKHAEQLAQMLEQMAQEDRVFVEPPDVSSLPLEKQIEYYVFKMRDIADTPSIVPGRVNVFRDTSPANPALALARIGKPAMPVLVELLRDDRPTRSYSDAENWNHLFKYSDAAIAIIERIAAQRFEPPRARGPYFSSGPVSTRRETADKVAQWWQANKDKLEAE